MDIVLLIFAIVYAVKRNKMVMLQPSNFPNVPVQEFETWKRLELRSRDIIMWVGFAWIALEIIAAIVVGGYVFTFAALALPVLLIVLTVSAVFGSKAAKIKKAYCIKIPK